MSFLKEDNQILILMIRSFIYNSLNDNWVQEEQNLLFHDICVFIDEERYLHRNGPLLRNIRKEGIQV